MQKNKRAKLESYEDNKSEHIIVELRKSPETSQITSKRISAFPITFIETDQNFFDHNLDKQDQSQQNKLQRNASKTAAEFSRSPPEHYGSFTGQIEEDSDYRTVKFSPEKGINLEKDDEEEFPEDIFDDTLLDEELVRFF
ncbi:hypothetical protein GpartN1_g3964.t1 [Galdieria partita]|uniref:Uncharacterized protein n=1 Tax=Galdieria partita TaxID=83374 RepID=A0A9C7UQS6_9RHOD|nr:hypothetical protein GpartN1_g3964.t1 [Galdieria partita]